MIQIKTIAGRQFIELPGADGKVRTHDPLQAIGHLNAEIAGHQSELSEVRIQISDQQQAIRRAVLNGRDTRPHRERIAALETNQSHLASNMNNLKRIADQVRQAITDANAGLMLTKAIATQATALSNLSTEDYQ